VLLVRAAEGGSVFVTLKRKGTSALVEIIGDDTISLRFLMVQRFLRKLLLVLNDFS
jgi:hypothetical protein